MKKLIFELGVVPSIEDSVPLLCDNNGAIAQAKEPRSHQKSKHILRRYHLIREIKQMLQLLIKKKGLELEKEDKQPMLTVSTLQLGVWVTNSQQDSDLVKALEGSANERIEAISGEELGVKDRLENR